MKHLKVLGLAAIAAVALMAFLGACTASATVICKTQPTNGECPAGWTYSAGAEGEASLAAGTTAVLETTTGEALITCTELSVESVLDSAGGATATATSHVASVFYSGCTHTLFFLKNGSTELHWIPGTSNGTLTITNNEVTVIIFGVSCNYGAYGTGGPITVDLGTVVGGNPASITVNSVFPKTAGGFLCPNDARFTGKFVATAPTAAWVAER